MRYYRMCVLLAALLLLLTGCSAAPVPAVSDPSAPVQGGLSADSAPTDAAKETKGAPEMEEIFGCEAYPLKNADGSTLLANYLEESEAGRKSGYWPVVVYLSENLNEVIDNCFERAGGVDSYVNAVLLRDHSNGKERLEARFQDLEAVMGKEALEISDSELTAFSGQLSGITAFPAAGLFSGEAWLLRVPAEQPYEVFAWLPFCGWNSCPKVDDMIAICRYWYEQYGAIPAMITYDTLAFYLETPVTNRQTAKALAREQVAFCDGVFEMGGPVLYAASVLNSNFWSFWWD